jgi:hypothetical protein
MVEGIAREGGEEIGGFRIKDIGESLKREVVKNEVISWALGFG